MSVTFTSKSLENYTQPTYELSQCRIKAIMRSKVWYTLDFIAQKLKWFKVILQPFRQKILSTTKSIVILAVSKKVQHWGMNEK